MNFFKVGINFDFNLIPLFKELNEKYEGKGKIIEVYGSDRAHASLAARPDFRLPDVSSEDIKKYVRELKELGIMFNYTMNSIFPYGSKKELLEHKQEVINFVKWLEDIGVYRITVANPIMLEIIRNEAKSNIKIEMSTIAHIDTVTQIKYYKDKYNVDKVCGNLLKNRDLPNQHPIDSIEGLNDELMSIKNTQVSTNLSIKSLTKKIDNKIRTVNSLPSDMEVGEYIFLEKGEE